MVNALKDVQAKPIDPPTTQLMTMDLLNDMEWKVIKKKE